MAAYAELREAADRTWAPFADPKRTLIKVGVATCSRVVGAEDTLAAIREAVKSRGIDADVMMVGCNGLCYAEPLVEVQLPGQPGVLHQQVTVDKVGALLEAVQAGSAAGPSALAVLGERGMGDVPPIGSLPLWRGQVRRLMANCGVIDPENLDHAIANRGYEGLDKALRMDGEAVTKEDRKSVV